MHFLKLATTNPYYNLALEEHLLCSGRQGTILLLWQNHNTIVVGHHQNTHAEINTAFVEKHGIHVVRRRTGGGAVYHDLGNVNFSFISDSAGPNAVSMARFTQPVVQALQEMGLEALPSGRNDIEIRGCKVSGNAQALHKGRVLHHGTLLFASDLGVLSQALTVRPEKFQSKGIQSVRSRVANIQDFLPAEHTTMDINAFTECLTRSLSAHTTLLPLQLTPQDEASVQQLYQEKYTTWEWNYGKSPRYTWQNSQKFAGGFVEAFLVIEKGRIQECTLCGDFMSLRPVADIAHALCGIPYEAAALESTLGMFPLAEYFGSITQQELLECLTKNT